MTDTEQPQQPETQEPEHSNIKLIYEHVVPGRGDGKMDGRVIVLNFI